MHLYHLLRLDHFEVMIGGAKARVVNSASLLDARVEDGSSSRPAFAIILIRAPLVLAQLHFVTTTICTVFISLCRGRFLTLACLSHFALSVVSIDVNHILFRNVEAIMSGQMWLSDATDADIGTIDSLVAAFTRPRRILPFLSKAGEQTLSSNILCCPLKVNHVTLNDHVVLGVEVVFRRHHQRIVLICAVAISAIVTLDVDVSPAHIAILLLTRNFV